MKHFIAYSIFSLVVFASCTGTKMATYNDDVYASPTEDRREQARLAAANKRAQEAYQKRYNDSTAAAQARANNNPYYRDPQYNSDDYYDYAYATRVKRFQSPVSGLGYYDNYYTNTYFYSGNPYQYGMSVYNGYSFWPSYNSYNYFPSSYFYSTYGWGNAGFGMGYGSGYGYGYDPFMAGYYSGYNHGYNSGFWGSPYGYGGFGGGFGYGSPYGSPFGYGGYGGYGGCGSPYGWGYYNGYDQNSGYTYAPRESHDGGNGSRPTSANVSRTDPYYQSFVQKVVSTQANTPKFTEVPVARSLPKNNNALPENNHSLNPVYNNPGNNPNRNYTPNTRENNNQGNYTPYNNNNPNQSNPVYSQPSNNHVNQQNPAIYDTPRSTPTREYKPQQEPVFQQQPQPTRNYEPAQSFPAPSNSFPRGGGGGGGFPSGGGNGGRPR